MKRSLGKTKGRRRSKKCGKKRVRKTSKFKTEKLIPQFRTIRLGAKENRRSQ